MKKLAAILICLILASAMLTGCGVRKILAWAGLETREAVYTESSTDQEETDAVPSAEQDETDAVPSTEQDETETVISTRTDESSTDNKVIQGSWTDNVYTNEFAEILITLPEDWTYSSKEQMADLMKLSLENLTDEAKYNAEMSKIDMVYGAVATNPSTGDSVLVLMEKQYTNLDAEQYIDIASERIVDSYKEFKYTIDDIGKQTICGNEYVSCHITLTQTKLSQTVLARRVGNYMVDIIISDADVNDESAAQLSDLFSVII